MLCKNNFGNCKRQKLKWLEVFVKMLELKNHRWKSKKKTDFFSRLFYLNCRNCWPDFWDSFGQLRNASNWIFSFSLPNFCDTFRFVEILTAASKLEALIGIIGCVETDFRILRSAEWPAFSATSFEFAFARIELRKKCSAPNVLSWRRRGISR